jgi:hypothetical protein
MERILVKEERSVERSEERVCERLESVFDAEPQLISHQQQAAAKAIARIDQHLLVKVFPSLSLLTIPYC